MGPFKSRTSLQRGDWMNYTREALLLLQKHTENTPLKMERNPSLRSGQKNPLMTTQRNQPDWNFHSMQHQAAFL